VLDHEPRKMPQKIAAEVKGVAVHGRVTDEEQVKAGPRQSESTTACGVMSECDGIGARSESSAMKAAIR